MVKYFSSGVSVNFHPSRIFFHFNFSPVSTTQRLLRVESVGSQPVCIATFLISEAIDVKVMPHGQAGLNRGLHMQSTAGALRYGWMQPKSQDTPLKSLHLLLYA
jgi:hypothetical protein